MSRTPALVVVLCLLLTAPAAAQAPRWTRATPDGGWILALAQAPSAPETLYAAAQTGRLFRSLDGGASWQPRGPAVLAGVRDLVIDPVDPRTLYAMTGYPQPLRTRDAGRTWAPAGPGLHSVAALALDAEHPGVVLAATAGGLYRSLDGGDSWDLAAFAETQVAAVAIDPGATATLFAAVGNEGDPTVLWKSTDRGATWVETPLSVPAYTRGLPRFAFDPAHPGTLYLAFAVTYDFDSTGPVLRSRDGGTTWTELPAASGNLLNLAVSPRGDLFAATAYGVARSTDFGATWSPRLPLTFRFPGEPGDTISHVLASPTAPGELFAAGVTGVWHSRSGGARWAPRNRGLLAQGVYSFGLAPDAASTLVALGNGSVFRSTDRGTTWRRLPRTGAAGPPIWIEAFDPRHPETIYGLGSDGQADFPLVSQDGGRTWNKPRFPYNCHLAGSLCDVSLGRIAVDPHDPEAFYVSGSYFRHFGPSGSFLLRSDDGGTTWDKLAPLESIAALVFDPTRRGVVRAIGCDGFFQSGDGGASWQTAGRGLPRKLCTGAGLSLAIDPQEPRRLYAGTAEGVFLSTDDGATFRPMNRGLETAQITSLQIDPANSDHLYAGAAGRGVFRWSAPQRRWLPLNQGLPGSNFNGNLALDPRHPTLLYANTAQGIFRLDLAEGAP